MKGKTLAYHFLVGMYFSLIPGVLLKKGQKKLVEKKDLDSHLNLG